MDKRTFQVAGALMIAGAVLANVSFTLLGSSFNYPDILEKPAGDILRKFNADSVSISAMFVVLALASALLIPIAWFSRNLIAPHRPRARQVMLVAGVAAGIVQVVGLLRWPLLVPHFADIVANPASTAAARADAIDSFKTIHTVLGGVIGEAFGYTFTAIWTITMVVGVARRPGRWFAPLGIGSAVLIATGLLEPLGLPGAGVANFIGYIAWSVWMIGYGISLLRRPPVEVMTRTAPPSRMPSHAHT